MNGILSIFNMYVHQTKWEHVQSDAVYDRKYIDIFWIIEWKNVIDP